MGGCATKPKVLKGEEGGAPAPAPAPEPPKEETAAAGGGGVAPTNTVPYEAKDIVVVEEGDGKNKRPEDEKVDEAAAGNTIINNEEVNKEIVEEDQVDGDQESKPRSLSNLFKNEQGNDSTELKNAPSEPVKEETKEAGKPKEESETTTKLEAQNSEAPLTPESFVDATDKDETAEKTAEATETETEETTEKKKEAATDSTEKKIEEAITESEEMKKEEAKGISK